MTNVIVMTTEVHFDWHYERVSIFHGWEIWLHFNMITTRYIFWTDLFMIFLNWGRRRCFPTLMQQSLPWMLAQSWTHVVHSVRLHTDTSLQYFCLCLLVTINHLIRQSLPSTTTGWWYWKMVLFCVWRRHHVSQFHASWSDGYTITWALGVRHHMRLKIGLYHPTNASNLFQSFPCI